MKIMKKLFLPVLPLLFCGCASIPFEQRPLACVMPFVYSAPQPEYASSTAGLQSALTAALFETKRIRLVERQRMEAVAAELKLAMTGLTDANSAVQVGRQLGAKYVIMGSVTAISVKDEWRSVKIAEKTDRIVEIEAEARMVDIQTGELAAAGKAVSRSVSSEKHAFGGKVGSLAAPEAIIQKAVQGLADKLAADIARDIRPVK
ncbi:MAG TPA: CsgG/HfaB family protein [Elusimicrobiales bacterium]|nr:CsgG/HfaB family protein [Elusimicrobiales bacterium]